MAPGVGSADKTHRNRRHYCRLVLPNATQRACSPPCTETVSLPSKARTNADACKDCRRVQGPESQNGRMQPRVACRQMPTECWEGAEIDAGSRDRDQRGINMNMKTKTTNHWRSKGILVCQISVCGCGVCQVARGVSRSAFPARRSNIISTMFAHGFQSWIEAGTNKIVTD